jgi:hypothetical protein
MLVTFATDPPDITEPIAVPGVCGETVAVWAWGGHVVVETAEGPDLIVAHLDLAMARTLAVNIDAAIIAASLLASAEPRTVTVIRRVPWIGRTTL